MRTGTRIAAAVCIVASAVAFMSALWGGGMATALQALLELVGLASSQQNAVDTPLGLWVLLVYVCGVVAGVVALRRPKPMGVVMLALGVVALFFGGPIARVYGAVVCIVGLYLIAVCMYRGSRDAPGASGVDRGG